MINKLKTKISLIIFFAITVPVLFIVIFSVLSYYNNTIRSNTMFFDRINKEPKEEIKEGELPPDIKRVDDLDIINMDGVYSIIISNNKVIRSSDNVTDEMIEYAKKIENTNSESGIIDSYIYKKDMKELRNNEVRIYLVESKSEINKINIVIFISILGSSIAIILVYILSKKIAKMLVKPVEDTFSKQIEFISDASHELKTPLAVIQANADVLEEELKDNKWLSYIQNETDNMGKLINELLLLTKIENVDKLRNPEKFNISSHIELVVASFESMAYEKEVKIETKIEKDVITNSFNKDDITHILSTLIDNAIKHTDKNKKVIVEFDKNKDNIIINVKNKGIEIPVEERDKIFDRFYRIDKSRNRNEKRYGLGLAIAKSTVLKNNGSIGVDYKDGYTVFCVKLPL